jgi:hypothetical protein
VLRSIASEFRGVARNAYNSMDASVVADSTQHTTICPRCRAQRPLSQAQVEIGRAPICDGCGGTMIVQGSRQHSAASPSLYRYAGQPMVDNARGPGLRSYFTAPIL